MVMDKAIKPAARGKAFTLSADPNRAVQEMIAAIDALQVIYVAENEALRSADTKKFLSIQDRKLAAARDYQSGATQLMERKDQIKSKIDPRLSQALKARQNEFTAIGQENLENLERMRRCTKRLSERLMQAARDTVVKNSHAYGKRGRMQQAGRRVSMGLNESA
jgi:hypothetical protein